MDAPIHRIPYISKDALFWQIRYNILNNRQENKKIQLMRCIFVFILLFICPLLACPGDNPKNANNIFRLLIALDGSYPDFSPEIIMDTAKTK